MKPEQVKKNGAQPHPYVGGKPFYSAKMCKESALRYKTRLEWAAAEKGAHDAAYRNGWIEDCCAHMPILRKRSLEECLEIALRYPTRNQWCLGDEASYAAARRNGWMDKCTAHMRARKLFTPPITKEKPMLAAPQPRPESQQIDYPAQPSWQRVLVRKNGKWPVILLAGAPPDIFRETKQKWEDTKGVELKYHWDYQRSKDFDGVVPADVDLVIVFRDFIGHAEQARARREAQRAGVPILTTGSKKAFWDQAFYRMGIKNSAPLSALRGEPEKRREPEPPKLVVAPPPFESKLVVAEPKPTHSTTVPPLNIVVTQQTIPIEALPARRLGVPRPETAALLAVLQGMCAEDGIEVIVEPTGFQVSAAKT